eukprot:m.150920 g.150920  ORF g.150920 m.150920 type:complete len:72 (-) comp30749_c0_seq1:208-423(-)
MAKASWFFLLLFFQQTSEKRIKSKSANSNLRTTTTNCYSEGTSPKNTIRIFNGCSAVVGRHHEADAWLYMQ